MKMALDLPLISSSGRCCSGLVLAATTETIGSRSCRNMLARGYGGHGSPIG